MAGTLRIELAADVRRNASINLAKVGGSLTDYQDSIQTNYSTTQVFGRADPIVSYQNSPRNISFGVQFVNEDKEQKASVQDFVAQTMALQYPTYENQSNALSIRRPPIVLVTLEGLLDRQLCAMKGFAFTPQAGFTPQNSPEIRFGEVQSVVGDTIVAAGRGSVTDEGSTKFRTITTKYDFIVLHRTAPGFKDEDLSFFGEEYKFGDFGGAGTTGGFKNGLK